jgi:mannose-6-phosphate isomerase-like protein (cupin superfamily)
MFDRKAKAITIKENDLVLIRKEANHKLEPVYAGPFSVIKVEIPNIIIRVRNKEVKVHMDRAKKYFQIINIIFCNIK